MFPNRSHRKSSSNADLRCHVLASDGSESSSLEALWIQDHSSTSVASSSVESSSGGGGTTNRDRKTRRRRTSNNRADLIRQQLVNDQQVKATVRSLRRTTSLRGLMETGDEVVKQDVERVDDCLKALEQFMLEASRASAKKKSLAST